jgi:hypothetical protein
VQEQWDSIWIGYQSMNPEWYGLDHDRVRDVVMQLWDTGRIHQPRKFGARPQRRPEIWLEAVLPDSELEQNPSVKAAWDQFQVLAGLAGATLDNKYQ